MCGVACPHACGANRQSRFAPSVATRSRAQAHSTSLCARMRVLASWALGFDGTVRRETRTFVMRTQKSATPLG